MTRAELLARSVEIADAHDQLVEESKRVAQALAALDAEGPWVRAAKGCGWDEVGPWVEGVRGHLYRCGRCAWSPEPEVAVLLLPDGTWEGQMPFGVFRTSGRGKESADAWLDQNVPVSASEDDPANLVH